MIGDELEKAGWRQGAIIQSADTAGILESIGHTIDDSFILIVASQSCDITYNNLTIDPYIELSVARRIQKLDGNFTHNKNPRILHASMQVRTSDADICRELHVELKAYEKLAIPKNCLLYLTPDNNSLLKVADLESIRFLAGSALLSASTTHGVQRQNICR